ncbi:hypothetical protein LPB41_12340 [Thalassospira sp. MA62]|nr:hypothetical protein [Thalassospira sp. MA62]
MALPIGLTQIVILAGVADNFNHPKPVKGRYAVGGIAPSGLLGHFGTVPNIGFTHGAASPNRLFEKEYSCLPGFF